MEETSRAIDGTVTSLDFVQELLAAECEREIVESAGAGDQRGQARELTRERKVLLVDDDKLNLDILKRLLSKEYRTDTAETGDSCLEKVPRFQPGLVLLDIMMPGLDGYEVCRRVKSSAVGPLMQVILVSAKASAKERLKGYQVGADDYVVKPFDHDELLAKVRIQFRLRDALQSLAAAHAALQRHNQELERLVQQRTGEIVATRDVTVFALAKLAESRDPETGEHLERIRGYCAILAEELSQKGPYTDEIDAQFQKDLYQSSPLHDIGKVGIPDAILLKPDQLSPSEFELMKQHALIGAEALTSAAKHGGCGSFLAMAADIARCHHERFDGSGYPRGLRGLDIPLPARIVALADVYDALASSRVYKCAFRPEVAKAMIEAQRGKHFDPAVVDAFCRRFPDFLQLQATGNGRPSALASATPPS